MTRTELAKLIQIANRDSLDVAFLAYEDAERECQIATYEAELQMERDCDDRLYRPGCGEYDSVDGRGRPLLKRVNDAGEPRW